MDRIEPVTVQMRGSQRDALAVLWERERVRRGQDRPGRALPFSQIVREVIDAGLRVYDDAGESDSGTSVHGGTS